MLFLARVKFLKLHYILHKVQDTTVHCTSPIWLNSQNNGCNWCVWNISFLNNLVHQNLNNIMKSRNSNNVYSRVWQLLPEYIFISALVIVSKTLIGNNWSWNGYVSAIAVAWSSLSHIILYQDAVPPAVWIYVKDRGGFSSKISTIFNNEYRCPKQLNRVAKPGFYLYLLWSKKLFCSTKKSSKPYVWSIAL